MACAMVLEYVQEISAPRPSAFLRNSQVGNSPGTLVAVATVRCTTGLIARGPKSDGLRCLGFVATLGSLLGSSSALGQSEGTGTSDPAAPESHAEPATEVIVRGDPLPLSDQSASSLVLRQAELDAEPSGRIENALADVPGLHQYRRSDSRMAHPTSQGLTLRGLGGNASSRALVLLDGVPQADPFGGWISWPAFDAPPLESIRLRRGGGTGADGPGALADSDPESRRAA
jgi:hypothetical protein